MLSIFDVGGGGVREISPAVSVSNYTISTGANTKHFLGGVLTGLNISL